MADLTDPSEPTRHDQGAMTEPQRKSFDKIAFVASETSEAREALARLTKRYGNVPVVEADVVVALGGDGLMLQTLHNFKIGRASCRERV